MNYEQIINTIAAKYNLKPHVVEHILDSQFRTVSEQIEANVFKVFKLIKLGKIVPNGRKDSKKYMDKRKLRWYQKPGKIRREYKIAEDNGL